MTFDTSLLDAAIAQRKAQNERQRQEILAQLWLWFDRFGETYGMQEVYVFGSLAIPGRFTERSDVDVAIASMQDEAFFEVMGRLSTEVGREVDLVLLNQCHFAHRIREQGILWNPSL
jgi:uncharacterized protein